MFMPREPIVNHLAANPLDRTAVQRRNVDWVNGVLADPHTRYVAVANGQNLVTMDKPAQAVFLCGQEAVHLGKRAGSRTVLGAYDGVYYVAINMDEPKQAGEAVALSGGRYMDLKKVGPAMDPAHAATLAYANAMTFWHRRHRFCGACGTKTAVSQAGHVRRCPGCNVSHFPRTDGAIIVLIIHGDRCLLARQAEWPKGVYATVAGFLEPGESLEGCVQREVKEETGLTIDKMIYHSSQPWPFPGSIMVGFHAHSADTELHLSDEELEDARWFTREELEREVAEGSVLLPHKISISYRLIEDWLNRSFAESS
ncbi:MAG: NAD(+) diphosphatase [Acidobacteriota bacterium]|nr:NAD(+) diphosphatase [Acidobacteriota bacterium]